MQKSNKFNLIFWHKKCWKRLFRPAFGVHWLKYTTNVLYTYHFPVHRGLEPSIHQLNWSQPDCRSNDWRRSSWNERKIALSYQILLWAPEMRQKLLWAIKYCFELLKWYKNCSQLSNIVMSSWNETKIVLS